MVKDEYRLLNRIAVSIAERMDTLLWNVAKHAGPLAVVHFRL